MTDQRPNQCVTITGPRAVEARAGETPTPAPGEVLIRTAYSGISAGTEMNVYRGDAPQWRSRQDTNSALFVNDEPEWTYPLVYGYANVGVVEELGSGVTQVQQGTQVFSYKPHCTWVTAPADQIVVLPELADVRRGVFVANLNTAYNGVLDARPSVGDVVVVSGLGVIGQLLILLLKRAGVGTLIGVDRVDSRRRRALAYGADHVFDPGDGVAEAVRELTGGRGADIVVEASGASAALHDAIRIVGFEGLVLALSWYGGTFEGLRLSGEFHHNRIRIRSSQVGAINPDLSPRWTPERRMAYSLDLLTELPLENYITHAFAPDDAQAAYTLLDTLAEDVVQCVFEYETGH
jgi:2-desacetyl-2-hydroxyethyl bacteriochlorophyllide A dehydrogenase